MSNYDKVIKKLGENPPNSRRIFNAISKDITIIVKDELEQLKLISKTNIDILIKNIKLRLKNGLINREETSE